LRISSLDDLISFLPYVFDLTNPGYWFYSLISQPIPRFLWENKPYIFETLASKYSAPEIFKFGGSESVGLFGEAFFSAHIFGPFCYGIFLVIIVKGCISFYLGVFKSNFLTWGGVVLLPYSFFTSGLLFSSMTIQLVYTVVLSLLLKFVLMVNFKLRL